MRTVSSLLRKFQRELEGENLERERRDFQNFEFQQISLVYIYIL